MLEGFLVSKPEFYPVLVNLNQEIANQVLYQACTNNPTLVRNLLSNGCNPNYAKEIHINNNNITYHCLYNAVTTKNIEITKLLLEHNANCNDQNGLNGLYITALHAVVTNPSPELAILLLQYGADPGLKAYIKERDGYCFSGLKTPLQMAVESRKIGMVHSLLWSTIRLFWIGKRESTCSFYYLPSDIILFIIAIWVSNDLHELYPIMRKKVEESVSYVIKSICAKEF